MFICFLYTLSDLNLNFIHADTSFAFDSGLVSTRDMIAHILSEDNICTG